MDVTVKDKWLKALRSGNYKQAKGTLRKTVGYCCLGVLCDVVDNTKWVACSGIEEGYYNWNRSMAYCPFDIQKTLKLSDIDLDILMRMNDEGKTFSEIADYIERQL